MISETFTAYLLRDGVNWSRLKEMARSPLHYKYRLDHERPDTKALAMGRGAHTAILEPDRFPVDYAVFKGARRAGKEWEAFQAANEDRSILRADEYDACLAMRDAVRAHPVASRYLAKGRAEQTVAWANPLTGLACKGRIDWLSDVDGGVLCDLKTTANLDPPWFASRVANLKYHGQLAYYIQGLLEMDGLEPPAKIIAVESSPPYDVAVFDVGEDALWAGLNLALELLQKVAACQASGAWPGRLAVNEEPLVLPPWAFPPDDEDTGYSISTPIAEEA